MAQRKFYFYENKKITRCMPSSFSQRHCISSHVVIYKCYIVHMVLDLVTMSLLFKLLLNSHVQNYMAAKIFVCTFSNVILNQKPCVHSIRRNLVRLRAS